jgi:precorrin-2 methylase
MKLAHFSRNASSSFLPPGITSLALCFALVSTNLALSRFALRVRANRRADATVPPVMRGSEVLVKFRDGASETDKNNVALSHGTTRGRKAIERRELGASESGDQISARDQQ